MLHLDDYMSLNDYEERPLKAAKLEKLEEENEQLKKELEEIKKMLSAKATTQVSDTLTRDAETGTYKITFDSTAGCDISAKRMGIKDKLLYWKENKKTGELKFYWNITDLETILDQDPELEKARPKLNTMTNQIVRWDGKPYTDAEISHFKKVLDVGYCFLTEKHSRLIEEAVRDYAQQCRFNPLQDFLRSCRDKYKSGLRGKYSIEDYWIKTLGAEDDTDGYTRTVTKTFMINACKIAMYPGSPVRQVPILAGDQGIGKSTSLKRLAFNPDFFSDSVSNLTNTGERDNIIKLMRVWIGEMGEGKELKYYSAEALKNFLTQYKYDYKPLYAKYAVSVDRHTVFCITTNNGGADLLNDSTGNTRYDVLDCKKSRIDPSYDVDHIEDDDIVALWGEAMVELEAHPEYLKSGGLKYDDKILEIQKQRNAAYNFTSASWDAYDDWMSDHYENSKVSAHQLSYLSAVASGDDRVTWSSYTNKQKKDVVSYLNNRKDDNGNHCFIRCLTSQAKIHDCRGDGVTRTMRDAYEVTPEGKAYFESLTTQADDNGDDTSSDRPSSIDELFDSQYN